MNKIEIATQITNNENEIRKLEEEIIFLRNQLNSKEQDKKELRISKEDQVEIFMSYFKGRDDVFSYLSIDKKNPSKKYYIPACYNEWNKNVCNKTMRKPCKICQYRDNKPLTPDVYYDHIFNDKTIGLYPMLDDETCYFIAFDFDDKKDEKNIKYDVLAFWNTCDEYNVPISVERSRSGHGFHIWLFFDNKIKAIIARKLGSLLLSKTMETRDNLKISSFDRMFPSQDLMPKGGHGNLIVLPFQTEARKYDNTLFIDKYFLPIKGQIEYLKNLRKLSYDDVKNLINTLSNQTIDIGSENLDIKKEIKNKKKNNFKFPKEIKLILDDMVYIDKADLNAGAKNCFRRLASFYNPEF